MITRMMMMMMMMMMIIIMFVAALRTIPSFSYNTDVSYGILVPF